MQFLCFVPDIPMVKFQYRLKTGVALNLKNPKRFTEKIQLYKLFYRDPIMKQCVDKYEVRGYIDKQKLGNLLTDCYGVYNSPDEIDYNLLPKRFVIKDTLGGGGNSVVIVKDKKKINKPALNRQMQGWVDEPYNKKHPGREWVYDGRKHRIIIEEYIESNPNDGGLVDYKFFCNYGKIKFLYVISDRELASGARLAILTPEFKKLPVNRADELPFTREIHQPTNYEEMKRIAEKIAKPFPEARIDLYNVKGRIIFGEITFFDGSGYMTFTPDEYDEILGDCFEFDFNDYRWHLIRN